MFMDSGQRSNSPYSAVIPIFINRMLKKLSVVINGGFQTRDFVYVEDVVDVMLMSMKKNSETKNFPNF